MRPRGDFGGLRADADRGQSFGVPLVAVRGQVRHTQQPKEQPPLMQPLTERSPGADVEGVSPVPVQMWAATSTPPLQLPVLTIPSRRVPSRPASHSPCVEYRPELPVRPHSRESLGALSHHGETPNPKPQTLNPKPASIRRGVARAA